MPPDLKKNGVLFPYPQNLKSAIEKKHGASNEATCFDNDDFDVVLQSVGVGTDTEYGRWLAECFG